MCVSGRLSPLPGTPAVIRVQSGVINSGLINAAADHPDDAGAPDALGDLVAAEGAQLLGDQRAGAVGVEQHLRVGVDVAAP